MGPACVATVQCNPMRPSKRSPSKSNMQKHGTLKDTQSLLRHASIKTTGDAYVQ
jgi:hypothetical protein